MWFGTLVVLSSEIRSRGNCADINEVQICPFFLILLLPPSSLSQENPAPARKGHPHVGEPHLYHLQGNTLRRRGRPAWLLRFPAAPSGAIPRVRTEFRLLELRREAVLAAVGPETLDRAGVHEGRWLVLVG